MLLLIASCGEKGNKKTDQETKGSLPEKNIRLVHDEANKKVDVLIDGKLFTSYIYPNNIKKPVLYPLITPNGTKITRKYPLEPSVGERVDHPHHVGLWLNYGDVNGFDFWNNSDSIKLEKRSGYGSIKHREILKMEDGNENATLKTAMDWEDSKGNVLLKEETDFVFSTNQEHYIIDRITTLTAIEEVLFKDNKEGMLGVRVTRALEHPSNSPGIFTDANGKPTKVAKLNNDGVTGNYISSNNIQGTDAWGKRADWVNLTGTIGQENIALAILDHKKNAGYPTYWHARGYGLFAANPLGQKVFSNGKDSLNLTLKKGEKTTFRHRIIVASSHLSNETLHQSFSEFSQNQ